MNRTFKGIAATILSIATIVLTGCGNNPNPEVQKGSTTSSTTTESTSTTTATTVTTTTMSAASTANRMTTTTPARTEWEYNQMTTTTTISSETTAEEQTTTSLTEETTVATQESEENSRIRYTTTTPIPVTGLYSAVSNDTAEYENIALSNVVTTNTSKSVTTTATSLTTATVITTTVVTKKQIPGFQVAELPNALQSVIDQYKKTYPNMKIGAGLMALDGSGGYGYNIDQVINGACTVKAPYSLYVCKECQKQNLSLWQVFIPYNDSLYDEGSGSIKKAVQSFYGFKDDDSEYTRNKIINEAHRAGKYFKQEYSLGYLLNELLGVSDNIAYKMLQTRFGISGYRDFLKEIDGQNLWQGQTFGQVSVRQRYNEWVQIYSYITSSERYGSALKQYLHNTKYCYLVNYMNNWHDYYHKSGWCTGTSYNSAADVAVIDNKYMLIVLCQDNTSQNAHVDVVKAFGLAAETYVAKVGVNNLF